MRWSLLKGKRNKSERYFMQKRQGKIASVFFQRKGTLFDFTKKCEKHKTFAQSYVFRE